MMMSMLLCPELTSAANQVWVFIRYVSYQLSISDFAAGGPTLSFQRHPKIIPGLPLPLVLSLFCTLKHYFLSLGPAAGNLPTRLL